MKKIFFAIIALAALVGCNTNVMEEVATTPAYLTTSFEVDLNGESRAFDSELKWSWESTDEIAALQFAEDKIQTVNKLTLKTNGKFGAENFQYKPDPATFVFVYPFAAYDEEKQDVGYVQTGEWTPTLVGIVNDATVNNIGTVEMNHISAAFEIRVWDEGRQARKTIKAATITSKTEGGVSASLTNRSTNTVVFNVAGGEDKGKNVVYDITLVDENDRTYTISNKELNFVNGKRTILNVEWKYPKPVVSFNVLSSYTNKDNSLDGRSIYVKDVVLTNADSAAIALYLNGNKAADLTPGKTTTVSNLALGEYKAVVKWTVNGKEYTSGETKVYVTGIPYTLNPKANDNWNAWSDVTGNSNIDWNVDGTLRLGYNVESISTWDCSTQAAVKKSFYLPENTTVTVMCTGQAIGSDMFGSKNSTIFSLTVSDATVDSTESGKASTKSFNYNKSIIMTSAKPTVVCSNSNSVSRGRSQVSSLTIKY